MKFIIARLIPAIWFAILTKDEYSSSSLVEEEEALVLVAGCRRDVERDERDDDGGGGRFCRGIQSLWGQVGRCQWRGREISTLFSSVPAISLPLPIEGRLADASSINWCREETQRRGSRGPPPAASPPPPLPLNPPVSSNGESGVEAFGVVSVA